MDYPKIIAVDFDGTLCENKWPSIGEPKENVIKYISQQQEEGAKIILWTCRTGNMLNEAVDWCFTQGITFDAVNENLPNIIENFGGDTRKIFANEYIDDKNYFIPLGNGLSIKGCGCLLYPFAIFGIAMLMMAVINTLKFIL